MAKKKWGLGDLIIILVIGVALTPWLASDGNQPRSEASSPSAVTLVVKNAGIAKVNQIIKIITVENRARLCPKPDCRQGEELLRIPTNTKLKVIGTKTVSYRGGRLEWDVIWYKVEFQGKRGWVSEFDTDKAPKEPRYR